MYHSVGLLHCRMNLSDGAARKYKMIKAKRQADQSAKPVQYLRVERAGSARGPGRAVFLFYRDQDDFEDQAGDLRQFTGAGCEAARGRAHKLDLDLIDTE